MADGSVTSSERTVRTVSDTAISSTISSAVATLSTAHHFVSIKLTNKNFLFWRTQVVPFLCGYDLIGFVDGTNPCPPALLPIVEGASAALPNPLYAPWVRQEQAILSMLISSLLSEVMYLAVGCRTSQELWLALERALPSSSNARTMHLLGQLQTIRQGDASAVGFIARVQVMLEDLALVGRSVPLEELNMYPFRGLRLEYHSIVASLNVRGQPVSLPALADLPGSHEFSVGDSYGGAQSSSTTVFVVQRGERGRRPWRGSSLQHGGGAPSRPSNANKNFCG